MAETAYAIPHRVWWNPFTWTRPSRVTLLERKVGGLNEQVVRLKADLAAVAGVEGLAPGGGGRAAGPAVSVPNLVGALREEVAGLFAAPPDRFEDDAGGPKLVVQDLDIEIRGDLDLREGVGLRAYAADKASPQAASTIRFKLRPEVRIVAPPADDES